MNMPMHPFSDLIRQYLSRSPTDSIDAGRYGISRRFPTSATAIAFLVLAALTPAQKKHYKPVTVPYWYGKS